MARRRKSGFRVWLLVAVVAIAAGALGWTYRHRLQSYTAPRATPAGPVDVTAARIDPGNDGRRVRVSGELEVSAPPRDAEIGIGATAVVLLRQVEMYQWHESCAGDDCRYAAQWSDLAIDSRRFHHPEGHENPVPRLRSARFAGNALRIGAFSVGADLVAAQSPAKELPVHAADLPPNLAASFADVGGALYAGGDPAHPKVGEMRISYRIVPAGAVVLSGVQHGSALAAE